MQELMDLLEQELGDEGHKIAQQLAGDLPPLLEKLAVATVDEAPGIISEIMGSPFMAHLEAQLPTATLGVVHGLLGLVL